MSDNSLPFEGYNLVEFSKVVSELYKNTLDGETPGIVLENNIKHEIFAKMFGFNENPLENNKNSYDFEDLSLQRSINFSTFWNSSLSSQKEGEIVEDSSNINFSTLGLNFGNASGIRITPAPNVTSGNILATYIVIYALNAGLTLNEFSNVSRPINFLDNFTLNGYTNLIENLRKFLNGCTGLGNIRIKIGTRIETDTTYESSMNEGYIKQYCKNVEKDFCQDPKNNYEGEKCTTEFRQQISNNPLLSRFCGCFAPLPEFFQKALLESSIKGPDNRCDYFCYKESTYSLFQTPGESGNDRRIDCNDSTICVIDSTNVNVNNTFGGNILFEQICSCRSGTLCQCFLEVSNQGKGILDNITDSRKKGVLTQVNFSQNCSVTQCYELDENGEQKIVECNKEFTPQTAELYSLAENGRSEIERLKKIDSTFWIGLIIIIGIILVYIFTFLEITFSSDT